MNAHRDPLTAALETVLGPIVRTAVAEAMEDHDRPQAQPELLTAVQLCEKLQISRNTLGRLQHEGLPRVMVLDAPRYDLDDVMAWLKARGTKE